MTARAPGPGTLPSSDLPAVAAYAAFYGLDPDAAAAEWPFTGDGDQARWRAVADASIDAAVAAVVRAADGATVIVAFRGEVTPAEAEELHERWARYGPETVSVVIADGVAGVAVREPAAAEARIAEARKVIAGFLAAYGDSDILMFKVGIDLANSVRKVLGDDDAARGD